MTNEDISRIAALEAENESLRQIVEDFPPIEAELQEVSDRAFQAETQRDAFLAALQLIASDACADMPTMMQNIARAAVEHGKAMERQWNESRS